MSVCHGLHSGPVQLLCRISRQGALRASIGTIQARSCSGSYFTRQLRTSSNDSRSLHNGFMKSCSTRSYSTASSTTPLNPRPLHLAIIGSGPAGFYSARRLLQRFDGSSGSSRPIKIDMFERLPVPFGLVRFGVAPDHPEVKNCIDTFSEVASSPAFSFKGNVTVGKDVSLRSLRQAYDGILFAYGAAADRTLGIPREKELEEEIKGGGVYSARAFVGWYNGLPEYAHLDPRLDGGDTAVVLGQGNVALDVARVLLSDVDRLKETDMAEYALDALSRSTIRKVHVVGRRGPMQAPFTIKELRELMTLDGVKFTQIQEGLLPDNLKTLPRPKKRIAELLKKYSGAMHVDAAESDKRWSLDFMRAPRAFIAGNTPSGSTLSSSPSAPTSSPLPQLSCVEFAHTRFTPDNTDPFDSGARVEATVQVERIACTTAFRSIGYKSVALPGMAELGISFDDRRGIVPNIGGRVITSTGEHVRGVYCTGWVKNGPTGVIATTMEDAFAAAEAIVEDWTADDAHGDEEGSRRNSWDDVKQEVEAGNDRRVVSWQDWLKIDEAEIEAGKRRGKSREKFTSIEHMLEVGR